MQILKQYETEGRNRSHSEEEAGGRKIQGQGHGVGGKPTERNVQTIGDVPNSFGTVRHGTQTGHQEGS